MIATPALHRLVQFAERQSLRVVLVGDPRQLQAVGRGGLFAELCASARAERLDRVHRFTQRWEATASLLLRSGDPHALDYYETHHRIIPRHPRKNSTASPPHGSTTTTSAASRR